MNMFDGFYSESKPFDFDKNWLSGIVYESKVNPLMINPLQVYSVPDRYKDLPVYIVSPGMGDIAWAYSKLVGLNKPIVLAVCDGLPINTNPRFSRSMPFLRLLPNVAYSTLAFCEPHQAYVMSGLMKVSNGFFPQGGYLCANKWLEQGNSLDDFLPSVKTNRHFEMKRPLWAEDEADTFVSKGEPAIAFYTSSRKYYGSENLNLSINDWIRLIRETLDSNPGHKVVLVGSPWDMDLMRPVYEVLKATHVTNIEMVFDRDIAVTIEVLRRCKFLIGCVSGLTIISEYQRIPTIHLYPKVLMENINLMGTWESREMISNRHSLSLLIESGVGSIIKSIKRNFNPECQPALV